MFFVSLGVHVGYRMAWDEIVAGDDAASSLVPVGVRACQQCHIYLSCYVWGGCLGNKVRFMCIVSRNLPGTSDYQEGSFGAQFWRSW